MPRAPGTKTTTQTICKFNSSSHHLCVISFLQANGKADMHLFGQWLGGKKDQTKDHAWLSVTFRDFLGAGLKMKNISQTTNAWLSVTPCLNDFCDFLWRRFGPTGLEIKPAIWGAGACRSSMRTGCPWTHSFHSKAHKCQLQAQSNLCKHMKQVLIQLIQPKQHMHRKQLIQPHGANQVFHINAGTCNVLTYMRAHTHQHVSHMGSYILCLFWSCCHAGHATWKAKHGLKCSSNLWASRAQTKHSSNSTIGNSLFIDLQYMQLAPRHVAPGGTNDRNEWETEPNRPNRTEPFNSRIGRNRTQNRTEPNRTEPRRVRKTQAEQRRTGEKIFPNRTEPHRLICEKSGTETNRTEPCPSWYKTYIYIYIYALFSLSLSLSLYIYIYIYVVHARGVGRGTAPRPGAGSARRGVQVVVIF